MWEEQITLYSNTKILGNEFHVIGNLLYFAMNTDSYDIAREVIDNLYNKLQIRDTDQLYNIAKNNIYSPTSEFFDVVETFVLNVSAIDATEQSPDEFLKNRIKYIELIETGGHPTGLGEVGGIATAPAVANAIFNAVGVRVKSLPISSEEIKTWINKI